MIITWKIILKSQLIWDRCSHHLSPYPNHSNHQPYKYMGSLLRAEYFQVKMAQFYLLNVVLNPCIICAMLLLGEGGGVCEAYQLLCPSPATLTSLINGQALINRLGGTTLPFSNQKIYRQGGKHDRAGWKYYLSILKQMGRVEFLSENK